MSVVQANELLVAAAREAIVAAGSRLGARGLIAATEGNLSVRLPGGWMLVTPTAVRKDELEPSDLVVTTIDPTAEAAADRRRVSSDIAIHRAILATRQDVVGVVHAHLPASMGLTVAGVGPDPAILPETALLLPSLPFVPFGEPGSEDLAARVAAAFAEPGASGQGAEAVLLERHGAVAVGVGEPGLAIRQAVDRLELVEVLCRTARDALLVEAAIGARGGSSHGLSFRRRADRPDDRDTPGPGRRR